MIRMSEEYLRSRCADGKMVRLRGKSYRVGRMSYGDYFLEPKSQYGEMDGFTPGTIWAERISGTSDYKI